MSYRSLTYFLKKKERDRKRLANIKVNEEIKPKVETEAEEKVENKEQEEEGKV